jgi:hypothetical protein
MIEESQIEMNKRLVTRFHRMCIASAPSPRDTLWRDRSIVWAS